MDCLFCKIVVKEIPSKIVYETENILVIKDINPQSSTHLLLIPKTHYPTLLDCNDKALLAELLDTAKTVSKQAGVAAGGFRLVINTNEEGGQTVFHMHVHLLGGKPLSGKMG